MSATTQSVLDSGISAIDHHALNPDALCFHCLRARKWHDALDRCIGVSGNALGTSFLGRTKAPRITEAVPARIPSSIVYLPGESPLSRFARGFEMHISHEAATRLRAALDPFSGAAR